MTATFKSVDPRTGAEGAEFAEATPAELERTLAAAASAAADPKLADASARAVAMRGAAARLRVRREEIVELAESETGLPPVRLNGELERTCVQLEMLADVAEAGEHLEAIVDPADPDAKPVPRPDLRRILVPLGPVAVFGASNFPLAFSTAGGDTAAALAAGCPVVVKGHPAHPATGTLVAAELSAAVADAGLPAGTFGHVLGAGHEIGTALVQDDRIEAVAFTGSNRGGMALVEAAAQRPRPIPVFAEMGSLNPLVVTRDALVARGEEIAEGLAASVATFGGQLCTKPGVVFVPAGAEGDAFAAALASRLAERSPEVLLSGPIAAGFADGLDRLGETDGVERLTPADDGADAGFRAAPAVFRAGIAALDAGEPLREEHFGPAVVLIAYGEIEELREALPRLGGQLTATLHAEAPEHASLAWLVALATRQAGRVLFGGYPTGVSVTWAMQHGGPFPASSDAGSTSVGMTATRRFLRPVVFQSAPQELLPEELRDGNPRGIVRRFDGVLGRD